MEATMHFQSCSEGLRWMKCSGTRSLDTAGGVGRLHHKYAWVHTSEMIGTYNDINVLQRFAIFAILVMSRSATMKVMTTKTPRGTDRIFPWWVTLWRQPPTPKIIHDLPQQADCKKYVERALRMLQTRWIIVCHPDRTWSKDHMRKVMTVCVIMRNMIVQSERDDQRIFCE